MSFYGTNEHLRRQ